MNVLLACIVLWIAFCVLYVLLMLWAARVRKRRWARGLYSLNELADRNDYSPNG